MSKYEEYVIKLRKKVADPNYEQIFYRMEHKLHRFPIFKTAFAGTLVTAFVVTLFFLGFWAGQVPENGITAYVFQQQSSNGEILDYVFLGNGTFFE